MLLNLQAERESGEGRGGGGVVFQGPGAAANRRAGLSRGRSKHRVVAAGNRNSIGCWELLLNGIGVSVCGYFDHCYECVYVLFFNNLVIPPPPHPPSVSIYREEDFIVPVTIP